MAAPRSPHAAREPSTTVKLTYLGPSGRVTYQDYVFPQGEPVSVPRTVAEAVTGALPDHAFTVA